MNGLSTLNRLLGKKNKDVSKSTSNLSRSSTNLDASSQYNSKVIQLPIVPNAPYEQTFRVTVLLPRDQLYVARVGAKTKLSTLLDQVCSDKLLDAQKYVFRHPADFQHGFELDMNIGEVGLSEIRLMSRKELEALRNSDYRLSTSDIFRMHQKTARETTTGGTSLSSSDLSRTSKLVPKTTSPYSSTNSLNSMDSSGVSSSSRGGGTNGGHAGNGHHHHQPQQQQQQSAAPPVAPTRKKRAAPRPPSQSSIPEVRPVVQHTPNGVTVEKQPPEDPHIFKEPQLPPYSRQNFHVSTPDLYDREPKAVDILNNNNANGTGKGSSGSDKQNGYAMVEANNNNNNNHVMTSAMVLEEEDRKNLLNTKTSFSTLKNRPTSMYIIREPESAPLQRSSENGGSMMDINHSRASSSCSDAKDPRDFQDMPEPTPRKRLNSNAKKSKAPAPPPRAKMVITPVPTPSPRALTRSTLDLLRDNDVAISETDSNFSSEPDDTHRNRESRLNAVNGSVHRAPPAASSVANAAVQQNVSKVMLNVEQAPNGQTPAANGVEKKHQKTGSTSSVSIKIGGPADQPSAPQLSSKPTTPIVSKVQIGSGPETPSSPSPGDNSSDEEIKIYNIESGKAMIKKKVCPGPEQKTEVVTKPATNGSHNGTGHKEPQPNGGGGAADEEQWTYTLPAPPKFADSSIKANDYDERHQFYRPASTFVDNTTLRTDMLTVMSDETVDRIKPFFQERLQTMELNLPTESRRHGAESPTSDTTTHVSDSGVPHISSDLEDGYRVGADGGDRTQPPGLNTSEDTREAREVWLQTLEKRREKIIESELATLSESIGGKPSIVAPAPRMVSPPEAVIERKSSVMNELNQLLRDGVELTRKEDADIAVAANRSSLANFKISTYSSENKENIVTSTSSTTTVIEQQQEVIVHKVTPEDPPTDGSKALKQTEPITLALEEEAKEPIAEVIAYRKTSADAGTRKAHSLTQSSDEDDATHRHSNGYQAGSAKKELAPVKRRSLTMLNKSPRVINRSDSFHSTRSDYIQSLNSPVQPVPTAGSKLHLTPRSTSYISLIGAQRWENRASVNGGLATSFSRRKSTSELSICDSPSLQSLEVIKNILNTSRKNSINNLHHAAATAAGGATEQNGLAAGTSEEIALPSMAAIKRNSFTDISTLAQLNGKVVQLNGVASGVSVRKDSIEEAKVEEQEQEPEPEPEPTRDQGEVQPQAEPVELCVLKKDVLDVVEKPNVEPEIVKDVEEPKEPIKLISAASEEVNGGDPEASIQHLASESKSDDEKLLQNQHQQQQQSVVKEPQTTVVSITTTSTVVSSSSSNAAVDTPSNDTDTKKWTYQGPPTISFATWNERPKIDVSIKSDRDYRFGGSSTLPRGFRNVNNVSSTKISIGPGGSSTTETTTSVRRTIHEVQGRDDTEPTASNVPLKASQERQETVVAVTTRLATGAAAPKPIAVHSTSLTTIGGGSTTTTPSPPGERLPIVRAVEYKKNVVQRQPPPPVEPKPSYFYETFSRSDTSNSTSTTSSIGNVSSVSVNGSGGPTTTTISRLSLGPKPATVLQPTVRGFKSLDEATVGTSTTTITGPRLRPVSMIDTSVLRKSTIPIVPEEVPPHSLPFSQHTLRRTGLKEKILAKDPAPARVESATVPVPVAGTTNVVNGVAAVEPPIPAPTRPVTFTASMPSPPPPPPTLQAPVAPVSLKPTQPVVRGAIVKKSPANPAAGGAPVIDPRTALLDAIRGFNKGSLRK